MIAIIRDCSYMIMSSLTTLAVHILQEGVVLKITKKITKKYNWASCLVLLEYEKNINSCFIFLQVCFEAYIQSSNLSGVTTVPIVYKGPFKYVLRHQRGGWVGSENGNSWWFTVLKIIKELGGWAQKSQKHDDVILECPLR